MSASSDNERESGNLPPKTKGSTPTRRQRRQQQRQQEKAEVKTNNLPRPRPKPGTSDSMGAKKSPSNSTNGKVKMAQVVPIKAETNGNGKIIQLNELDPLQDLAMESTDITIYQPHRAADSSLISRRPKRRQFQFTHKAPETSTPLPRPSAQKAVRRPIYKRPEVAPAEKPLVSKPTVAKSPPPEPKVKAITPRFRPFSPVLYGLRLLILGVGMGAIAGTVISAWDSSSHQKTAVVQKSISKTIKSNSVINNNNLEIEYSKPVMPNLVAEITSLKPQIESLVKKDPKLQPGIFLIDIDNGNYFDWEGSATFSSASTIKLPILIAFFQDVDAGKIRLDEQLTIDASVIGSGSGELQYKPKGTKISAIDTIFKMITISDNTATNMIINRLGGNQILNQRFRSWGLKVTEINNPLPDLEGTNTTSPKELALSMAMINHGDLVSSSSRERMLNILRKTVTNTLLTKGLEKGATIAHKTGDIGSLVGDIGLITMPNNKQYIACVMVKRPHNDPHAQELIRQISRIIYQYFSKSTKTSNPVVLPSPTIPSTQPFTN